MHERTLSFLSRKTDRREVSLLYAVCSDNIQRERAPCGRAELANYSVAGREPGADCHKRQSSEEQDSGDFAKDDQRQECSYERSDSVVGARPGGAEKSLGIDIIIDAEPIRDKAKQQDQWNGPQVKDALPADKADHD